MARYEAHITAPDASHETVRKAGEALGWKFSRITGCPLLGPGTYCYLTGYATEVGTIRKLLDAAVVQLERDGIPVLRAKIERIVYDTRTGVDEIAFEAAAR